MWHSCCSFFVCANVLHFKHCKECPRKTKQQAIRDLQPHFPWQRWTIILYMLIWKNIHSLCLYISLTLFFSPPTPTPLEYPGMIWWMYSPESWQCSDMTWQVSGSQSSTVEQEMIHGVLDVIWLGNRNGSSLESFQTLKGLCLKNVHTTPWIGMVWRINRTSQNSPECSLFKDAMLCAYRYPSHSFTKMSRTGS